MARYNASAIKRWEDLGWYQPVTRSCFFPRRASPAELSERFLMLMNAFDKSVQSNTEQTGRGPGFARMFDRVCAFLDERVGGVSALVAACQSVADRFWHSKLYFRSAF